MMKGEKKENKTMNTKMTKAAIGLGAAILAGLVLAESPKVMQETVTLAVNTTNSTSYIAIADTGTPEYREIDRIVVVHSSGNATGTVDLAISELGTTTSLYNTGTMANGAIVSAWPRYPVSISSQTDYAVTNGLLRYTTIVVQNVVTGNVIMAVANVQTNYGLQNVLVPVTQVSTNYAPYSVKLLKVNVAQTTNLIPDVYKLTIYAK